MGEGECGITWSCHPGLCLVALLGIGILRASQLSGYVTALPAEACGQHWLEQLFCSQKPSGDWSHPPCSWGSILQGLCLPTFPMVLQLTFHLLLGIRKVVGCTKDLDSVSLWYPCSYQAGNLPDSTGRQWGHTCGEPGKTNGEALHIGLLTNTAKMAGPPEELKKWRRDPKKKKKASLRCNRAFD